MSETVSVQDAGAKLPELLERVERGEEVFIERSGRAVAKIVAIEKPRKKRVPGSAKGTFRMSEDFDDPLPPEIQKYFE